MLSLTTGAGESMYNETGLNGDIETILYPINHGILRFVEFEVLPAFIVGSPPRISDAERHDYLEQYQQRLLNIQNIQPIYYPALQDYDDNFQLRTQ